MYIILSMIHGHTNIKSRILSIPPPANVAKLKLYCVQATYVRRISHWLGILDSNHYYTNRTLLSCYLAPLDFAV